MPAICADLTITKSLQLLEEVGRSVQVTRRAVCCVNQDSNTRSGGRLCRQPGAQAGVGARSVSPVSPWFHPELPGALVSSGSFS